MSAMCWICSLRKRIWTPYPTHSYPHHHYRSTLSTPQHQNTSKRSMPLSTSLSKRCLLWSRSSPASAKSSEPSTLQTLSSLTSCSPHLSSPLPSTHSPHPSLPPLLRAGPTRATGSLSTAPQPTPASSRSALSSPDPRSPLQHLPPPQYLGLFLWRP